MSLRSGMSVQDLKMMTAEREYRIMMEQLSSSSSSSSASSPSSKRSGSFSSGVHVSSPRSTHSFSLSEGSGSPSPVASPVLAPQRPPSPPPMQLPHYYAPSYGYKSAEQRMLVTCGGQVVSLMEGVRNVPQECCISL
ncbi:hypothetical protein SPRG_10551 [Saprolegnia parasitica CBS 223.65]|uniref:Uncharacterized protein n=1 Tax=Saprolegnia parasitica (strain CBS 223.65) TaxID=695850 RepID=A0A067BZ40_SAPPC|nr:hypothetical protein SPRG_10551 [Saprolegnia parasitica CBS 223.65]KDO23774.1 hypothetical protein SPRG_10551 [Saprolegnia parasitica CBS 223.65]|eukprot:XP_012205589.1 hypothetical protein SPRG_10551 [Saprolegnia parasitica CBS 223.65]